MVDVSVCVYIVVWQRVCVCVCNIIGKVWVILEHMHYSMQCTYSLTHSLGHVYIIHKYPTGLLGTPLRECTIQLHTTTLQIWSSGVHLVHTEVTKSLLMHE
jgi:hypothetical protein